MAQELSLAGNHLIHLPGDISKLAYLQKLQLSGNYLESLPDSLCDLTELEVVLVALLLYTHITMTAGNLPLKTHFLGFKP